MKGVVNGPLISFIMVVLANKFKKFLTSVNKSLFRLKNKG